MSASNRRRGHQSARMFATMEWPGGAQTPRAVATPNRRCDVADDTCSVDGCDGTLKATGLCNAHYLRARRQRLGPCKVDDCDVNAHSRGLCTWHYRKWREETTDEPCAVEVCDRGASMTGLCSAHYSRKWYRDNGPERDHVYGMDDPIGVPQTYSGAHAMVRRELGPAPDRSCVDCGAAADHWSYNHAGEDEQVCRESGHPFSLDLSNYAPRCVTCHNRFDRRYYSEGVS